MYVTTRTKPTIFNIRKISEIVTGNPRTIQFETEKYSAMFAELKRFETKFIKKWGKK